MSLAAKIALLLAAFAAGFGACKYINRAQADHAVVRTITQTKVVMQKDTSAAEAAYKELDHAKAANADLRAQLAAGTKRMYVRATCPPGEAGGVDHEAAYAELDGQTSSDLVGITDEGDEAIRQLNALQDYIERE